MDVQALLGEELFKRFNVADADVENPLCIQQLRAAGNLDDEAVPVRSQIIGRVKQAGHAGIDKHVRHLGRLDGINV